MLFDLTLAAYALEFARARLAPVFSDVGWIARPDEPEAVDDLDAICRTPGVDAVFIGPSDLSAGYGVMLQPNHPDVQAGIREILAGAREHADHLRNALGPENVYFEIQNNKIVAQDKANEGIVRLASEFGGTLVGTGDVHYLKREDYGSHTALLCVQTKSTLSAPKMSFETNEFFLRDNAEMSEAFARWPEAGAVDEVS